MSSITNTYNKVALITGASKGIGRDLAKGLAGMGFRTVLTARNEDDLKKVSNEIRSDGGPEPDYFVVDIRDEKSIRKMIDTIVVKYDRIDILVNNAGIHRKGTLELSEEEFNALMDTNITGQFLMTKAVVPVMKKQGTGYIFNISSRSGTVGFAGTGGYCASKWGLRGLSESLYRELTPLGIKVTALCPAWVDTDMADRAGSPLEPDKRIQTEDLFHTIQWLLNLSSGACVKEVVITNPKSL